MFLYICITFVIYHLLPILFIISVFITLNDMYVWTMTVLSVLEASDTKTNSLCVCNHTWQ